MNKTILLMAASSVLATSAVQASLVQNGGFETGNLAPDWYNYSNSGAGVVAHDQNSGTYALNLENYGQIYQNVATADGSSYVLDFWAKSDNSDFVSFSVAGNYFLLTPTTSYHHYTYTFTAVYPEALAFYGNSGNTYVDDVMVSTAVPEPSTVVAGALLLLPFGVSTMRNLRKNRGE